MTERYVAGDTVRLKNTFSVDSNSTYVATDPTNVTLTVTDPAGSETAYTNGGLTNSATGVWFVDYTASTNGLYTVVWTGDSPAADVAVTSFPVDAATVDANHVLTVGEARDILSISATDTTDDRKLIHAITAVSRRLDDLCGNVVARTVTNQPYYEPGRSSLWVTDWPVLSWTTVTEYNSAGSGTVLTQTDYDSVPADGFFAHVYDGLGAAYTGKLTRTKSGAVSSFDRSLVATYESGRFTDTATVDGLFKQAAGEMLKALWEGVPDVMTGGGFAVARMRTFAVPESVKDLLANEVRTVPLIG